MIGLSRTDGTALSGIDHIAQSVGDIMTTPLGTRVMRRDYGSLVPDLLDRPMTGPTILQVYAAIAMALAKWEPRVRLERLTATDAEGANQGRLTLRLDIVILETGEQSNIEVQL